MTFIRWTRTHTRSMQKTQITIRHLCVAQHIHVVCARGNEGRKEVGEEEERTKKAYGDERGSFERTFYSSSSLFVRIKKKNFNCPFLGQNCPCSLEPDPSSFFKCSEMLEIYGGAPKRSGVKTCCCLLNSNMIDCLDRARESVNQSSANSSAKKEKPLRFVKLGEGGKQGSKQGSKQGWMDGCDGKIIDAAFAPF